MNLGFTYAHLHEPARLAELDRLFREHLASGDPDLAARFERYRAHEPSAPADLSALLVEAARALSRFLAQLFGVEEERRALTDRTAEEAVLFRFRFSVFQKRSAKKFPDEASLAPVDRAAAARRGAALVALVAGNAADEELRVARTGWTLFDLAASLATPPGKDSTFSPETARARVAALRTEAAGTDLPVSGDDAALLSAWTGTFDAYVALLRFDPAHRERTARWASFRLPRPFRFDALVPTVRPDPAFPEMRAGLPEHRRHRDGFDLTDRRKSRREVTGETFYCILCQERDKDSCSKGFLRKEGGYKANPLGVSLAGCPLDEKIGEMHALRREGDSIGALALVSIDNPMLPGTGHRICNDCMKGCIFQSQDPVDIPQAETGVLTDVLGLPWGFEIWSLLTRWNPLNAARPFALPYNGKNVLVVGLGPAGYTLAHHLLNEGFGVVAVDGLKIEPLPEHRTGTATAPPEPIRDASVLFRPLDERTLTGFGGVSEYGITVRWDKNFLDILYLNLARRRTLKIYDGVRFGGTLTHEQAFDLGFDHIAIAAGAGRPTLVEMKNNLIKGVRQASDFLMALQLTGAFKANALANLHLELPVVVVGGGLTAIDTATESLAYYPAHVEKLLRRFETLVADRGEEPVLAMLTAGERATFSRQLAHARAIREERAAAAAAARPPDLHRLLQEWGGSTIAYRRSMEESPAYRLNHEEILKALEEGIVFAENLEPVECVPDEHGAVTAVVFRRKDQSTVTLPCRTLLIAAGTTPNITYAKEFPGALPLDAKRKFFRPHVVERTGSNGKTVFRLVPKDDGVGAFFTGGTYKGRFLTYFGDNHPVYAGSVVKAMASARDGAPRIRELFAEDLDAIDPRDAAAQAARDGSWAALAAKTDDLLRARVVAVERLTPTIVEVVVKAPQAARNFQPGQFYRLQNYETFAPKLPGAPGWPEIPALIEPCALTGASVDRERGLLSMIALEIGVSTRLVGVLKPGEPVVVMGPTGAPTELPENSTVILCGGGLGNAVLFSIGRAARERGNRVLYFAGYKQAEDFYKREEIEAGADVVVYSVDRKPAIPARRPSDFAFVGNIVEAMTAYATGKLGAVPIPLADASRLIAIGSDRMMAAVAAARHGVLSPFLREEHVGIGSINSPMQCMMKEVCAQCLQRHVDPVTRKESFVFSCMNQDQCLDDLDWEHLRARLAQNALPEKISNQWLERGLSLRRLRTV
jgi:NADPH-dependent glutamate synthase beta subunit-like oxidoreductase/NAD(P)H-flavin reductase